MRAHLHRVQELLRDPDQLIALPTASETIRLALRRLLLVLLGERANLCDPADPYFREYLTLLDAYDSWPGLPTDPRAGPGEGRGPDGRKMAPKRKLKGGTE